MNCGRSLAILLDFSVHSLLTLNFYSFCRGLAKITYKGHILSIGVVVKRENGKSFKKKLMP